MPYADKEKGRELEAARSRRHRASYRHDLKELAQEDGISQIECLRRLIFRELVIRAAARGKSG